MIADILDEPGTETFASLSPGERRLVASIFAAVETASGVSIPTILGRRRSARAARARHLAMTLVRASSDLSLHEIGRLFDRDHGTVIWAVKAVAQRRARDPRFDSLYLRLIGQFAA